VQSEKRFDFTDKSAYNPLMTKPTMKRKKFTVGLWMDAVDGAGKPTGLQFWSIMDGEVKEPKLKWHTIVLALDETEALQLGQDEYAGKHINKPEAEAA
jgi:hypothetical protein